MYYSANKYVRIKIKFDWLYWIIFTCSSPHSIPVVYDHEAFLLNSNKRSCDTHTEMTVLHISEGENKVLESFCPHIIMDGVQGQGLQTPTHYLRTSEISAPDVICQVTKSLCFPFQFFCRPNCCVAKSYTLV